MTTDPRRDPARFADGSADKRGAPAADPVADPPGRGSLGPAVERFDDVVDRLLERVRGRTSIDRLFVGASDAGDFSLIWHSISIVRGVLKRRPDQVVALAVAIGLESLIVNQGLKRLFHRTRPTIAGDDRLPVRQPVTSSFPSGHASAAMFAATMLSHWDGRPVNRLWWTVAATIATSRAYVRIHHASDVVGGILVGRVLGLVARRAMRRMSGDRIL